MPRKARIILANTPHHITQRGHNRRSVFAEARDYEYYLRNLFEWKDALGIKLFGWCLMTNHVHLILQPGVDTETVGVAMRRVAGRQTRFVNALERRSGTLWDGRYHASPIQTETYLLRCARYVELNPVRAKMALRAEDYEWSSYRAKVGLSEEDGLDLDPCYLALGASQVERAKAYAGFVDAGVSADEYELIHHAARRNQLTGDGTFVDEVERRIGARVEFRGPGRPRASDGTS